MVAFGLVKVLDDVVLLVAPRLKRERLNWLRALRISLCLTDARNDVGGNEVDVRTELLACLIQLGHLAEHRRQSFQNRADRLIGEASRCHVDCVAKHDSADSAATIGMTMTMNSSTPSTNGHDTC